MVIQRRVGRKGVAYRVIVRIKETTRTSTFHSKDAARKWGQAIEDAIKGGTLAELESKGATLWDAMQAYNDAPSRTHEKTLEQTSRMLAEWNGLLGRGEGEDVAVGDVTTAQIQAIMDRWARRGAAGSTVNRKRATLSGFFTSLVRQGILTVNPVARTTKMAESKGLVRYLSDDERSRLFAACRADSNAMIFPLVVVATYSGMRRGELFRLVWSDINLTTGQVTVQISKNGDTRSSSALGPALEALREWRRVCVRSIGNSKVFPGAFPARAFVRVKKAAGVNNLRFHDLRHTAASYLAMMGASNRELQEFLGHRSLEIVSRYAHLSPSHMLGIAGRMAEQFR